jgi:hypothetical protein
MSLLPLPADYGTRWTRTAEPSVGPSSYPLDRVERIESWNLLLNYEFEVLNRKFYKLRSLPAVGLELLNLGLLVAGSSSYPLDHAVFVERIILELPDEL